MVCLRYVPTSLREYNTPSVPCIAWTISVMGLDCTTMAVLLLLLLAALVLLQRSSWKLVLAAGGLLQSAEGSGCCRWRCRP